MPSQSPPPAPSCWFPFKSSQNVSTFQGLVLWCTTIVLHMIHNQRDTAWGQASKISKKKDAWNDERYCEAERSVWTHVELWAFLLCTRWSWVIVTRGKLDKSVCLRGGGYILLEAVSKYSFRISRTNFAFCLSTFSSSSSWWSSSQWSPWWWR